MKESYKNNISSKTLKSDKKARDKIRFVNNKYSLQFVILCPGDSMSVDVVT